MKEKHIEDGKNRFLRIGADEESKVEENYEVRMIHNNLISGLLVMCIQYEDRHPCYDYNISGLSSLKECEEEEDQIDYLYSVIFSLDRITEALQEYMLSLDKLLLEPEYIFVRKEIGTIYFCYYPEKKKSFQESIQELMEHFVKTSNPTEEKKVLLLYGLYQKSREKNVVPKALANYWRESLEEKKEPLKYQEEIVEIQEEKSDREDHFDLFEEIPEEDLPETLERKEDKNTIILQGLEFIQKNRVKCIAALMVLVGIVLFIIL